MGVFEWVVAGLLLCILFAILRINDHIKQESFWIKDHLIMIKKEVSAINETLAYDLKDEIKAIERHTEKLERHG